MVIERLFSRVPEEDSDFSNWGTSWWKLQDELMQKMTDEDIYQGKKFVKDLNGKKFHTFVINTNCKSSSDMIYLKKTFRSII